MRFPPVSPRVSTAAFDSTTRLDRARSSSRQLPGLMDRLLHAALSSTKNPPEWQSERTGSRVALVISALRIVTTPQFRGEVVRTLADVERTQIVAALPQTGWRVRGSVAHPPPPSPASRRSDSGAPLSTVPPPTCRSHSDLRRCARFCRIPSSEMSRNTNKDASGDRPVLDGPWENKGDAKIAAKAYCGSG